MFDLHTELQVSCSELEWDSSMLQVLNLGCCIEVVQMSYWEFTQYFSTQSKTFSFITNVNE